MLADARKSGKKVLMAMSGGVDSSAAAIILRDEGYEVIGATMLLADENNAPTHLSEDEACEFFPEARDAKASADKLGIEHRVFDLREAFEENVVKPFCRAYISGKTPNPCIDCNRKMKFGLLDLKRIELGCDYLATGHYAIRDYDTEIGRFVLRQGKDCSKDQSYVLAFLSQEMISHMLFPLGNEEKGEVRTMASRFGLANADKEESQDICFIKDGKYAEFIENRIDIESSIGPIIDEDGKLLGEHEGLHKYTIGQRKGLGVAAKYPLYVVSKNVRDNSLIVGPKERLMTEKVTAHSANLVTSELSESSGKMIRGWAKTHYRHKGANCEACFNADGTLSAIFDEPIVKAAPGQTLVVYDGDKVVGAGIID